MKKGFRLLQAVILSVFLLSLSANTFPQDEKHFAFDAGGDLVSNYIWRGTKFGSGPSIQPFVELSVGNLTIGAWGAYCFSTDEAAETDIYAAYTFDFGLSLGMTDYYYPGTQYFDVSNSTGAHGFELNLGYETGNFSVATNYMLNQAGDAGTVGGDKYFELGYSFSSISLFVGAGDGWHTNDGSFALCNVGISTGKKLELSETLSIPVTGKVILNPDKEQVYVVIGVSF